MGEIKHDTPTNFVELLGNHPKIKIIDLFLESCGTQYNLSEIAEYANVSYASVKNVVPQLLNKNIIYETYRVGKIKYYEVNVKNPVATKLRELKVTNNKDEVNKHLLEGGKNANS